MLGPAGNDNLIGFIFVKEGMMNRFLGVAFALFSTLSVFNVAAQDTLDHALLWRIDDPGAPAPSYLFGTIHLIDADEFLISDSLMAAVNRSERLVFEIDPAEMTDMSMQMSLMMSAFMKGDTTLRDLLTDEEYAQVKDRFAEIGLPMMFLDRVKPMFLSMLTGMDMGDLQGMMGGENESEEGGIKSYEMELSAIAEKTEKEVDGLESSAYQMSLFDSIPLSAQADMLMASLEVSTEDGVDPMKALTDVYTSGDIDGMYTMSIGEEGGLASFEELLLVNRNKNWVEPIKTQVAQRPTLFAVGAGHLGGPEGMVRLLRAEGLTLTPLSKR
ncbi:MAG: TraB/GumN family protein [Saprospiraceae bacterium]